MPGKRCSLVILAVGLWGVTLGSLAAQADDSEVDEVEKLRAELQALREQLDQRISQTEREVQAVSRVVNRTAVELELLAAGERHTSPPAVFLDTVRVIRRRDWTALRNVFTSEAYDRLAFELFARCVTREAALRTSDGAEWTQETATNFAERADQNLVAFCSRWIPLARLEAGEPLGRRPEELSIHDVSRLGTIVRQRRLFHTAMDVSEEASKRMTAEIEFIRAFPNRSQLIGLMTEILTLQSNDHQFALPVSAAFHDFSMDGNKAEAALPGRGGTIRGRVLFQRDGDRWRISRLTLGDPGQRYHEIMSAAGQSAEKPAQ